MKKIILKVQNLKLKNKILLMILVILFLFLATSIFCLFTVTNSENQLLFKAVSGSLKYSADDIDSKISQTEYMTSSIVSNAVIRKNLITIDKEYDNDTSISDIRIENAKSTIETSLSDFHQTYRGNNISFINLYYKNGFSSSYNTDANTLSEDELNDVLQRAHQGDGYPVWITDYCSTSNILYLVRECRQVENLKFQTLGTVVVGISINRLISDSTSSVLYTDNVQYALYEQDNLFYHTDGIDNSQIVFINKTLNSDYGITTSHNNRFFGVRGVIENNGWNFICLIPYDTIAKQIRFSLYFALLFIVLVVIVAYIISHFFTKSINNDFIELVDKMKAFGENETQIPKSRLDYSERNDEIGVLHRQFDKMAGRIQNLIQENYIHEILVKDAKLKALESQINPHFLYNTLETINWKAKANGESDISSMVESLGMLLRETLSSTNDFPTLLHEINIVKNYITIQKIRFEERLEYSEDIEKSTLSTKLPHLTLQPLVENAIIYTIENTADYCSIQIKSKTLDHNKIIIDVVNSNSQFPPDILAELENNVAIPHGFGIGLLNIHKRLQLIYGSEYGLSLFNPDEEHAIARITIPGEEHV